MTESQSTAKCIVHLDNKNHSTELEIAVVAYRLGIKNDQVATKAIALLRSVEEKNPEIINEIENSINCDVQDI